MIKTLVKIGKSLLAVWFSIILQFILLGLIYIFVLIGLRIAGEMGHVPSLYTYASNSLVHDIDPCSIEPLLRRAAEQGHAEAQYSMALRSKGDAEKIAWLTKSSDQGIGGATLKLAECYLWGTGVSKDAQKAIVLYEEIANRYDIEPTNGKRARYELIKINLGGKWHGLPEDFSKAELWFIGFKTGCEKSDIDSLAFNEMSCFCREKAEKYYNGNGVQQDYREAAKWLSRAAKYEDNTAVNHVISMFLQGKISDLYDYEYEVIVDSLTRAAEQGNADAQYILGQAHADGNRLFVSQDYKAAAKWYTMAGEQGHGKAQLTLGYLYEKGKGVFEDRIEAYKWYLLAGMNSPEETLEGLTPDKRRDQLLNGQIPLNSQQIAEAESRARLEIEQKMKRDASNKSMAASTEKLYKKSEYMGTILPIFFFGLYLLLPLGLAGIFDKSGSTCYAIILPIYNYYLMNRVAGMNKSDGIRASLLMTLIYLGIVFTTSMYGDFFKTRINDMWPSTLLFIFFLFLGIIGIGLGYRFQKSGLFKVGLFILPFIFYPILGFDNSKPRELLS